MPMTLDEERREFAAVLADAINEWVNVESALMRVFHNALHGAHFGCSAAAYYAIVSFEAKLTMNQRRPRLSFARRPTLSGIDRPPRPNFQKSKNSEIS